MELNFEKTVFSCLEPVVQEVQNSEQTQEIKLPDGMPDIGHILCAWGQAILRSKQWQSDSIAFSGGMMVWVLYAPEDGSPERCIDAWIPFQMQWDLPAGTPEGDIRLQCFPRFVDARSVSARKMMVRAGMAAMAAAFSPRSAEVYAPEEKPEGVELLRSVYPVRLPVEAGEKTFLHDEDLLLPDSAPQPEKLIYYRLEPKIADKKVLSDKVVFRGSTGLHVLYRSEEGRLHSWDFEVPFSQYAELAAERSTEAQADILLSPTSLELETDDEGHLRLKCGIVAQYLITDKQILELIEDAYSPVREISSQTETLELPAVLENRRENLYGEQTIPGEAGAVADAGFYADFPSQRRTDDGVELTIPGTFQVLFYGEDGKLYSGAVRWEGQQSIHADQNSRIMAVPLAENVQASAGNGRLLAKVEMPLEMTTVTRQGISMVTGVSLGEQRPADPGRPSLILRRAGEDSLWDIAKASGSTMDEIRRANGLQEEPLPNQMLLIPVS